MLKLKLRARHPQPLSFSVAGEQVVCIYGDAAQHEILMSALIGDIAQPLNPAKIMGVLNRALTAAQQSGELAIITATADQEINFAGANIHALIDDGDVVIVIKGQDFQLGDDTLRDANTIDVATLPLNLTDKCYFISGDLFARHNLNLAAIKKVILNHHEFSLADAVEELGKFIVAATACTKFALVGIMLAAENDDE